MNNGCFVGIFISLHIYIICAPSPPLCFKHTYTGQSCSWKKSFFLLYGVSCSYPFLNIFFVGEIQVLATHSLGYKFILERSFYDQGAEIERYFGKHPCVLFVRWTIRSTLSPAILKMCQASDSMVKGNPSDPAGANEF